MSDILHDDVIKYTRELHMDLSGEELSRREMDNNFPPDVLKAIVKLFK